MDRQQRETGLVALQAAVLTCSIFQPATRRSDLGPEQRQLLMAIVLTEPAADAELPSGSAESLAAQLSLDRDQVHALFSLHAPGYLTAVDDELAGEEAEMPRFVLSAKAARRSTATSNAPRGSARLAARAHLLVRSLSVASAGRRRVPVVSMCRQDRRETSAVISRATGRCRIEARGSAEGSQVQG